MIEARPAVPVELRRAVLVEAGHRCAIPTCHATTTEIAHIAPWVQVRVHAFDNLIALCPNCHTRYDRGEIDRKAMLQYKANVSVLNGRYGDLERRLLFFFARLPESNRVRLPHGMLILLYYLLEDGYLVKSPIDQHNIDTVLGGRPNEEEWMLTPSGREFVQRWVSAQGIG